jgi:hypothetical protein
MSQDNDLIRFRAVVVLEGRTATGMEVPVEVLERLGPGKRPAVSVTVGGYTYRTTVGSMKGRAMLPLSAENRSAAGVAAGDEVEVGVTLDLAPRVVEVPQDLATLLSADPAARATFDSLAPGQSKEWVRWINDTKRPETRAARLTRTVEALAAGRRTR